MRHNLYGLSPADAYVLSFNCGEKTGILSPTEFTAMFPSLPINFHVLSSSRISQYYRQCKKTPYALLIINMKKKKPAYVISKWENEITMIIF